MTDQRALIPPKTFLGGDDFEVTVYGGRVHLTGYGWRGPEPLTAAEARTAGDALVAAADAVVDMGRSTDQQVRVLGEIRAC